MSIVMVAADCGQTKSILRIYGAVFRGKKNPKIWAESLVIKFSPEYIIGAMTAKTLTRKDSRTWRARRTKAEQLFASGQSQSSVARMLSVSRQCAHNWYWEWRGSDGTPKGQRRLGSGRKSKLDARQLAIVDAALRRGPRSFGFTSARWTLWRVAAVIERLTGVHYHPSSVWRILRTLGWRLRLPPKRDRAGRVYIPREWAAPAKQRARRR
jgi:transposase